MTDIEYKRDLAKRLVVTARNLRGFVSSANPAGAEVCEEAARQLSHEADAQERLDAEGVS